MFTSFGEASAYLRKNLNTYDPNNPLDDEAARDMLFDAVFSKIDDDTLETSISDSNKLLLQGETADENLVISILSNSIPNFYTIMTDMVAEILDEYMNEEENS